MDKQHTPQNHKIFVFGSNLAGRHGAGAALYALKYCGAIYGHAEGLQGKSYAIPTKDADLKPLPLTTIGLHVQRFRYFSWHYKELQFFVSRIGTGLAGYTDAQIAPLFQGMPDNVELPVPFQEVLKYGPVRSPFGSSS